MKDIRRVSITDAVAENIKEMICSGAYKVSDKLPTEARLCESLSVSRTSVREGIKLLQAQGYIEIKPGRGAFVADFEANQKSRWLDIDDANYKDYMDVRTAIELVAVRLAVERASGEQILELKNILDSFLAASKVHDTEQMVLLDEQFHTKIIDLSRNPLLSKINLDLLEVFRPYRQANFSDPYDYNHADAAHTKIIDCFILRNAELAEQYMREHLRTTAEDFDRITPHLKRNTQKGT